MSLNQVSTFNLWRGIKEMRRKLFEVLTVSVLVTALLAGCSEKNNEETEAEAAASVAPSVEEKEMTPADMRVGVCIYKFSDTYMSLFKDELINDLVKAGFKEENITIVNSALSQGYQMLQLKKLIASGVDILVVNPVYTSKTAEVTDLAMEAGVPLVYVNREPDAAEEIRWESESLPVTYIGCDARQAGTFQGKIIMDLGFDNIDKNGDGVLQYIMVKGEKNNADTYFRTRYSIDALKKAGWNVEKLAEGNGNWDKNVSEYVVTEALKENPSPEVIICNNDMMAIGALEAVSKAGLVAGEDVYIIGADAFEGALENILEGKIVGTVFNNYVEQARLTTGTILSYMKKQNVAHFYGSDYVKVTKENAETILGIIREGDETEEE